MAIIIAVYEIVLNFLNNKTITLPLNHAGWLHGCIMSGCHNDRSEESISIPAMLYAGLFINA
jgi:hypothetical protein